MSKQYDSDKETFMGVPRNKIEWFPEIDYEKCDFCMDCDEFCPHDVFAKTDDNEKELVVKNPDNCVVFCTACSKACPLDALSFPDKREVKERIKEIRDKSK